VLAVIVAIVHVNYRARPLTTIHYPLFPLQVRGAEHICQQDAPPVHLATASGAEGCYILSQKRGGNYGDSRFGGPTTAGVSECNGFCARRRIRAATMPRGGRLCANCVVPPAAKQQDGSPEQQ